MIAITIDGSNKLFLIVFGVIKIEGILSWENVLVHTMIL